MTKDVYPTRAIVITEGGTVLFDPWREDCVIIRPLRIAADTAEIDVRYDDGRYATVRVPIAAEQDTP